MKKYFKILVVITAFGFTLNSSWAEGTQGMPGMALIKPKKTYSVSSPEQGETLLEQRGFGDKEAEVRMMNLMMVEGSGFEGMDMSDPAAMKAMGEKGAASEAGHGNHAGKDAVKTSDLGSFKFETSIEPKSPKVGANILKIRPTHIESGKPVRGLKAKSEVFMTSMDMGKETPKVKEVEPGVYQIKAIFSMQGPWAVKFITADGEKTFSFQVGK